MEEEIKNKLKEVVKNLFDIDTEPELSRPKDLSHGDFASNIAMQLAASLGKNPREIATQIVENIDKSNFENIEIAGPGFINFKLKSESKVSILKEVLDDNYLNDASNKEKNIIVEFSSPNIAKPFTIGHLRSTIIGESVARILEHLGYNVFRDNHLGDWGASFGKYLAAFEEYNIDLEALMKSEKPIKALVDLYIKYTSDADERPEMKEKARDWFKKLEDGDPVARENWQKCIDISFVEFDRIYKLLGIRFTENGGRGYGESYFEEEMKHVLVELEEASKAGKIDYRDSEGAKLIFFEKSTKLPPLMIIKSNGTTLYSTRDLATDRFRKNRKEYGYPNLTVINEVGGEQREYFNQLYQIEKQLGWYKEGERVHVGHGLYKFKDGKMSTRKGNVIWLEDLLNKAIEKSIEASTKDDLSDDEIKEISKVVGIGAIKWNDLKRDAIHNITFDWDEILNLKGNSGPYIQYTYARAKSILKDSNGLNYDLDSNVLESEEEQFLLKTLANFKNSVERAGKDYAPHIIANYLYELAQGFNAFYNKYSVMNAETDEDKNARLVLTNSVAFVIKKGLELLGIETVEKM